MNYHIKLNYDIINEFLLFFKMNNKFIFLNNDKG